MWAYVFPAAGFIFVSRFFLNKVACSQYVGIHILVGRALAGLITILMWACVCPAAGFIFVSTFFLNKVACSQYIGIHILVGRALQR